MEIVTRGFVNVFFFFFFCDYLNYLLPFTVSVNRLNNVNKAIISVSHQITRSRFSTTQSKLANLSAIWNQTPGCPWCTSTTACGPRWKWWRRPQTHWAWGPTTSMPWASPQRSWPRRSRSRCLSWTSRMTLTTSDKQLVSLLFFYFLE